jgi:hypothetical protein
VLYPLSYGGKAEIRYHNTIPFLLARVKRGMLT